MTRADASLDRAESRSGILRATLLALGLSLVVNHAIRLVSLPLLQPIPEFLALTTWMPVTLFTVVGILGAVAVYAVLTRIAANPDRLFTQIAIGVLLLSFVPNIMLGLNPAAAPAPGVTWPNMIVLMLMHVPPAYFAVRFLTHR